jgi:site-specific recombinase XerD
VDDEERHVRIHNGRYQLIDDKSGPLEEANKFLTALNVRGLSSCTIRAYAFDLLILYRWMKQAGKLLRDLQQDDLLDFVAAQKKDEAHPSSINRRLTVCRLLYRFCTNQELDSGYGSSMSAPHRMGRGRDWYLGLHKLKRQRYRKLRVKTPRRLVEPLTREQVRLFLRSLRRYRDVALVHLMLLCGLRSREVLSLELNDINFDENRLRISGKGNKERLLPLPDILLQSLSDYIRLERPSRCYRLELFVVLQGKRRGHPMTLAGLRSLFRHRRINPVIATANPHRFRHTFGADMARSGVRLPILQKMMGHAHGTTTLQYINLSMADIADEYKRAVKEIKKRYETL